MIMQRQMPTMQKTLEIPQVQFFEQLVEVPDVMQRQVPVIQGEEIRGVPQVWFIDRTPCSHSVATPGSHENTGVSVLYTAKETDVLVVERDSRP